jgi:hypothetical protein
MACENTGSYRYDVYEYDIGGKPVPSGKFFSWKRPPSAAGAFTGSIVPTADLMNQFMAQVLPGINNVSGHYATIDDVEANEISIRWRSALYKLVKIK